MDTPSGPAGRQYRWHELLSRFDLHVEYIPGKDNVVADALSRWAYPAAKAFADTSIHGSDADAEEMEALFEEEKREEQSCAYQISSNPHLAHIFTLQLTPPPPESDHLALPDSFSYPQSLFQEGEHPKSPTRK